MIEAPRGAFLAANTYSKMLDMIGSVLDWFKGPTPLDQCKTADDVIKYANSIRDTQPHFANELIAAANRSE